MSALGHRDGTEELVRAAEQAAASALGGAGPAGFRAQWQALAKQGVLSDSPELRRHAPTGSGPVTRAVATVEGVGLAGTPGGLCYALTSQRFGIQFPLRSLLTEAAWRDLGEVELGEVLLCHALTEEGGGSDPLSMTTRAERRPDGSYLLTGRKAYVTAAPIADVGLVFARTAPERHSFALSPFLVDLHAPGVVRSAPFRKTALTEVPMGALEFTGVRLAPHRLVGEEGSGLAVLSATTAWERSLLLAYALGPMRSVLERTIAWCRSREHFGRRMGASHLVAGRVTEMALAFYRSRQLIYQLAGRLDAGENARQLASDAALTKISVSEDYSAFVRHAAMLGGVRSFIEDSGLTADPVGPMAAATYAGPNDLLRITVARDLGLPVEN